MIPTPKVTFQPEFVFKGKGTRTKLNPPPGIQFQWAPKGSYRLKNMEETIKHLPNRHNLFSYKNYAIYSLDNYSVHLDPAVKTALQKKGYIYVGIGGGITGDIQANDTDMHAPLKKIYRKLEAELMLKKLEKDPDTIPRPTKDEMMEMLDNAWKSVLEKVDTADRFTCLWLTNKLDGSEDYLVSQGIKDLVGGALLEFRKSLMENEAPRTLQEMIRNITPPKGVKRKQIIGEIPDDEGVELFDCEGDELEKMEERLEGELEEDNLERNSNEVSELDIEDEGDREDEGNREDEGDREEEEEKDDEDEGGAEEDVLDQSSSDAGPSAVEDLGKKYPYLRQDLRAVDDLKSLIVKHRDTTSRLFTPYLLQLQRTHQKARLSLRKRMVQCTAPSKPDDDDNDVADIGPEEDSDNQYDMPITFIDNSKVKIIM